ncbi:hypothetical protein JW964_15250 [candidate division KSB1 bacterium]|nr:hypothetical protein [candidate division KSB1 bacterium]
MSQTTGFILSYVFVFSVIIIATVLQKLLRLSPDFSRKIIHIGVGNWVFVALYCFSDWYIAIIPPLSFILINYLSYRYSIFKAMELDEKNPGTIYYAISLTILTGIVFFTRNILPYIGIVAMTWGDGMAAVIGQKYPLKTIRNGKSLGGLLAFILFTILASGFYLYLFSTYSLYKNGVLVLLFSFAGAFIEILTPRKFDNLSVPLILGLLGWLIEAGL